ncbi:hypothetical protein VTI74DRAFT_4059 [Chaetomium olivicolor]
MRALSRACYRPPLSRPYHGALWSAATCTFHSSSSIRSGDNPDQPDHSQNGPASSDDGYSAVRIDFENRTVPTVVGDLPISPLMDPSFHEARQRFRKPKPKPSQTGYKPTKFQRKLSRNPYALALAAPVRRCPISATSLPSFFLQRFRLVEHPETGDPYFVPQDLHSKVPDARDRDEGASDHPQDTGGRPTAGGHHQTGPSAYVLSRQQLLQELQTPTSVYFRQHRKLLRMSDHGNARITGVLNAARWRVDMDGVVLELMRRRVVEGLVHLARKSEEDEREYVIRLEKWRHAENYNHRGCLLWLGQEETPEQDQKVQRQGPPQQHVPRLSKMRMGPERTWGTLAVHNLGMILGRENVSRLREESKLFSEGSLFLLGRRASIQLQLLLWKLQGYMLWR